MSRIMIFNNAGFKLCEIDADAPRSWMIGQYGRSSFTIPVISDKCRKQFIQFGNLVLIEHEKLPAWGGVIDPPRTWGNNLVEVTAYSAEYLLKFRSTGFDDMKITAGAMFKELINIANRVADTRLITAGPIDEGGESILFELRNETIYDFAKKRITDAGYEWRIKPVLINNRLQFEASLYEKFESDTNMVLSEGYNIELGDSTLVEDGEIYNQILGFGKGSVWKNRYKYTAFDLQSQSDYGFRDFSLDVDEGGKVNVEKYTDEYLAVYKEARKKFDLSALDYGDTWKYLDLGNILKVELSVCGFNGDKLGTTADVRIAGMSYDESVGTVRLICEEQ